MGKNKKKPDGGRDKTPLEPSKGPTYTLRVTFHSAQHLPIADISTQSSDPFILAQINTPLPTRHKKDPYVRFRSATARRSLDPRWDAEWVIAGVPAGGCEFEVRVYDEDDGTHDDLLGRVNVHTGRLEDGFKLERQKYELRKSGADWVAWSWRACLKAVDEEARKDATLTMSIEVLGRTKIEVGKVYTVNSFWWTHYSPMLGHVVNTTSPDAANGDAQSANFQANQLQLAGPVPNELYHRYVDFHAFVPWMFERKGLRGRLLYSVLHRQHESVYHYDAETEYGRLPGPGKAMGQRFLDMTFWGEGKRIFTYIITLDGLMRFTETGPEFGIDMLSKHTMHSDVNVYIAYSGEFFVRKYRPNAPGEDVARQYDRNSLDIELEEEAEAREKHNTNKDQGLEVKPRQRGPDDEVGRFEHRLHWRRAKRDAQYDVPPQETTLHGPDTRGRSTDPADYELVIDNDSGTYRPDKDLLPVLRKYLEEQFGGLHVAVLSCTDDVDQKIKKKRLKAKAKLMGPRLFTQANSSGSSLSSSDAEAFEDGRHNLSKREQGLNFVTDPVKFTKDQYHHGLDKVKRHKGKDDGDEKGNGSPGATTPRTETPSADTSHETPAFNEKVGHDDPASSNLNPNQPSSNLDPNQPSSNLNPNINPNADPNVNAAARDPEKT